MIRFVNVNKEYNGQCALNALDFEIQSGEMAFITGHSGAGKSTLLKLILLTERATQGQIFINQRNLYKLPKRHIPAYRRDIGMIFQDPKLISQRTVFENVAIPLLLSGYRMQDIKRRVRAALDKVGLLDKERKFPKALSLGEQQRVGIARAVVHKPMLLMADEPTGNLDPELSMEILKLFQDFNAVGVTVLIATHDLSLIARLPHRLMTLSQGALVRGAVS